MQRKRVLKSVVLLVMMSMTLGLGSFASAQAPEDDVFAVIKISNPESLLPALGQFIDKFQPGMGGLINPMMVGNMVFNNPEWAGMDMAGDYTAVVLNPMVYGGAPFGVIVPVTDKDAYLAALSESLSGGEEADGIYSFEQANQKSLYVASAEGAGVLSESSEVAALVKALLDANSPLLSEVPVVKGQMTASLDFAKVMSATQPMAEMMKQQFLMGMQQEMEGDEEDDDDDSVSPEALADVAEAEFDVALSLLNQIEKVQIGISLEDAGLRLGKAVFAMKDSTLANFMMAQSPEKSALLDVIPSDSAVLLSASINFTPEFQEGYLEFFEMMLSVDEDLDAETSETLVEWISGAFEAFSGDVAAGMLSPTSDTLVSEVLTLKDAELAKELIDEYPGMLQSMMGLYDEMGVEFEMSLAETTEVKGGELMQYTFNFNADMIPDPEGQEVFKALFGEELSLPIGFTGDYAVAGFGKDAQVQVAQIMETIDSGADTSAEYSPASFGLPEKNNLFVYFSVPRILAWAVAKNLPDVPTFDIVEGPGLALAGRFVESYFEGEFYLPIEEMLILKQIAEQSQGQ